MPYKFLRGWVKNDEATTAIEFSLLFIPYVLLTLSIIELSMMYASASMLEGATSSAARLVKTGQVQQAGSSDASVAMFTQAVCDYATVLIKCEDIVIEVRTMESFTDYADMEPQYDEDGNMVPGGAFDAGGSNDRVLIRTSYRYTMMTPFIGPLLAGSDNKQTFVSTIVLQSEPYQFGGNA